MSHRRDEHRVSHQRLTLAEIRDTLSELPDGPAPQREYWERLAGRLRAEAQSRIDRLTDVLRQLAPAD